MVDTLVLSGKVSCFDMTGYISLTCLDIRGTNDATALDLSMCPLLVSLSITEPEIDKYSFLSSVNLSGCKALQKLECEHLYFITELDLSYAWHSLT